MSILSRGKQSPNKQIIEILIEIQGISNEKEIN